MDCTFNGLYGTIVTSKSKSKPKKVQNTKKDSFSILYFTSDLFSIPFFFVLAATNWPGWCTFSVGDEMK